MLLDAALAGSCPTAKVQLLCQAGALPPALPDLLYVIDRLSVMGLEALLTVGRPAVDHSRPVFSLYYDTARYTCPIHRALRGLVRFSGTLRVLAQWLPCLAVRRSLELRCMVSRGVVASSWIECLLACWLPLQAEWSRREYRPFYLRETVQILEALLAAGYRPTVWHNVQPPPFVSCDSHLLEVFDPFDWHKPPLSPW